MVWIFFFFPLSIFLFRFCCRNTFSLKLWVVNFIILAWFPFFEPPMGCILLTCFLKSFSSTPASFATDDITFKASSSFVSSSSGFQRPVTIMHDLWEYESALSSWRKRRVFTFRITASSPSIAETVPSKRPTLSISSSIIFCCFLIISSDLLFWWFSCCWDVEAGGAGGVPLMLVVQAFLGVFFWYFCFLFIFYSQ